MCFERHGLRDKLIHEIKQGEKKTLRRLVISYLDFLFAVAIITYSGVDRIWCVRGGMKQREYFLLDRQPYGVECQSLYGSEVT